MTFQNQSATDAIDVDVSSADQDLDRIARAIFIGTGGNLSLVTLEGNEITFVNIQDGFVLPCQTRKILNSGTTAANIIALF